MIKLARKNILRGPIKEILAWLLRYSGLAFLIRTIYAKNRCIILMYHNPSPEIFTKHLAYLVCRYNIFSLDNLVKAIRSSDLSNISRYGLVITIDDGHKDNHKLLPIVKRYNIKPTIYLTSQIIASNRKFWFLVDGVKSGFLKKLPNKERLKYLKDKFSFCPYKEFDQQRQGLSIKEIEEMRNFFDFGAHTRTHPILTLCEKEEVEDEIVNCKKDIEHLLKIKCDHFCYPNGDYADREMEIVKQAGFLSARTTDVGWNDSSTDPYKLKAIEIPNNASVNMLAAKLTGIPGFFCYFKKGSFNGKKPTELIK